MEIDKLLKPNSEEHPCGKDLQDQESYRTLERDIEGIPEKQMGRETIAAQEPNWKQLLKDITKLCAQTKDLNLAVMLSRILLKTQGLAGFELGLRYVHGLLDQYWQEMYPTLEADEFPIQRINILKNLTDHINILAPLRETPLVNNKVGKFSLRDYHIVTGNISPRPDEDKPDIKLFNAAFIDEAADKLQEHSRLVQSLLQRIEDIDSQLNQILGKNQDQGVSFAKLIELIKEIDSIYTEQLRLRGLADSKGEENASEDQMTQAQNGGDAMVGSINSREDVVRVLDLASDYFRRNEPSSPVPLLLQRAKHLLSKDFMEILRDLAPDAVKQAELIGGVQEKD